MNECKSSKRLLELVIFVIAIAGKEMGIYQDKLLWAALLGDLGQYCENIMTYQ